ncbi:DeoR/GlpR family DNA-binding transcription regulator [Salinispira pacifica]|uniref:Transcriptional repressor of aga operon n=1 Tax=Salinispira pacifica TaxID=1307761 RepID=V5WFW8_9SPIO|nr:DeoR/GlpR family DNA-binding transcription regulator [Salinispira pacifica]AHC14046.1 Transcriptional repressor of aga operon [Salinispira pacifica]
MAKEDYKDFPAERRNKVVEIVTNEGSIRVGDLARMLDVSEITIRRDLDHLQSRGKLERTHGGAVSNTRLQIESDFRQKRQTNQTIKQELARTVLEFVNPGDTLFVNSGTTMLETLCEISALPITIFTNNGGLDDRITYGQAELNFLGGTFRQQSHALVGPLTMQALSNINAGKSILGVDGFSISGGLTSPNMMEAEVTRKMIDRTRGEVILVADHSKIGVISSFFISQADRIDILVCDDQIPGEYLRELESADIRVIIAGQN